MFIHRISRDEFEKQLNTVVSPARPIQSIEHLVWRHDELERIRRALAMTGRHIFIYGDRGVGKTSLAETAAAQLQSSDAEPVSIACTPQMNFESVIANIVYKSLRASRLYTTKTTTRTKVNLKALSLELGRDNSLNDITAQLKSGHDPVEVLREALSYHSERPVVVVDEFDRIRELSEREKFGDFVKQLGDRGVDVRIIFTGVGQSLQDLLGSHGSAIRQLDTILLPTLPWDGRFEIVNKAMAPFGLVIDRDIVLRIAAISDGYPSYIHKITEKMLWCVFNDRAKVREVAWSHFSTALNDSIAESNAAYSEIYASVVNQRSDDYEEVLWSTADSEYLQRYVSDMFASYEYVVEQRRKSNPLDQEKYAARIRSLKAKGCGEILVPVKGKRGMYQYRENMFRGFVRMQAEAHGIQLVGKAREQSPAQRIHVPASAGRGYFVSKLPPGVHTGRKRKSSGDD